MNNVSDNRPSNRVVTGISLNRAYLAREGV